MDAPWNRNAWPPAVRVVPGVEGVTNESTAEALTVNCRVTAGAAAYTLLPAWTPLILQVPAFLRVTVSPLIVQMVVVVEERVTGRSEEAHALITTVGTSIDCGPGSAIVIVCGAFVTAK